MYCTYGHSDGGGRRPGTDRKAVLQRWHDHGRRRRHSVKNRLVPPRLPQNEPTLIQSDSSRRPTRPRPVCGYNAWMPVPRSPQNTVWTRNFGSAALFIFPVRRSDKPGSWRNLRRREASSSVLPSVGRFDYKSFIVRSSSPSSIDVGVIVLPSCTKGYPPFCLWHLYFYPLPSHSSFLIRLFISLGEAAFSRHSPEVHTSQAKRSPSHHAPHASSTLL